MIGDHFNISGTGEALLDFKDLSRVQLKNDDVQGFDTKWNEVLLSMTKVPDEDKAEHLFNKQVHHSVESNLSWSCISRIQLRKEKRPVILDWKMVCRYVEQKRRDNGSSARNEDRSLQGEQQRGKDTQQEIRKGNEQRQKTWRLYSMDLERPVLPRK